MARCETRGPASDGAGGARCRYAYHRPPSLTGALRLAEELPGARFIAGGTDLMVRLQARAIAPPALISLRGIDELHGVSVDDAGVRIGALTTIAELLEHATLGEIYPVLADALSRIGGPQVRNGATIGGNLCNASPCADSAPPLLVLGAGVRLVGARGARELPLERFFLGPGQTALQPGEILSHVLVPLPATGAAAAFRKHGRVRMDLALVSAAVLLCADGGRCVEARVAVGSVAPVPLRLASVEALLVGREIDERLLAAVEAETRAAVAPISDLRASADYRRQLVGVYVRRLTAALAPRRAA